MFLLKAEPMKRLEKEKVSVFSLFSSKFGYAEKSVVVKQS